MYIYSDLFLFYADLFGGLCSILWNDFFFLQGDPTIPKLTMKNGYKAALKQHYSSSKAAVEQLEQQ